MINVTVTMEPSKLATLLIEMKTSMQNRRALNAVLGQRFANLLKDHFRVLNQEPNKKNWRKTGFWGEVARATGVTKVDDEGATVTVADQRYRLQLFGGTVRPTPPRQYLTIPLVEQARGLYAASYERQFKRDLFVVKGLNFLFEKRSRGGDRSTLFQETARRKGSDGAVTESTLADRTQLRAVYLLKKVAKIPAEPKALPPIDVIQLALNLEAEKFLARAQRRQQARLNS